MKTLLALVAWLSVASITLAAVPGSVETWDSDLAGWQQSTTISTVVHAASDGNPDGHVLIRKVLNGSGFDVGTATTTSTDYLGDYAGVAGVSVDVRFVVGDFTDAWVRFRPGVGPNGWRYSLTDTFPETWTNYVAPLNPNWDDATALANGWEKDDPTVSSFSDLFSSVGWVEVRFDTPEVLTIVNVDNFRLIAVPEPGSVVLLGLAAAGLVCVARSKRASSSSN